MNQSVIDSLDRDLMNLRFFDQNSTNQDQNSTNHCQGFYPRQDKRISRNSSSSFDLNGGSGSSDSSGCSSGRSSDPSIMQICYPVENDEKSVGKIDPYSLNLFENYTFSVDSQERNDHSDDLQSQNVFENRELDDNNDGEMRREFKRRSMTKSCDFNGVRNFSDQQNSNLREIEGFPRTVGVPLKPRKNRVGKSLETEMAKTRNRQSLIAQNALANLTRSQNRNGPNSARNNNRNNRNSDPDNFSMQQPTDFRQGIISDPEEARRSQYLLNAYGFPANSNFGSSHSRFHNKKNYSNSKNAQKNGRPILSRSSATRPTEEN